MERKISRPKEKTKEERNMRRGEKATKMVNYQLLLCSKLQLYRVQISALPAFYLKQTFHFSSASKPHPTLVEINGCLSL